MKAMIGTYNYNNVVDGSYMYFMPDWIKGTTVLVKENKIWFRNGAYPLELKDIPVEATFMPIQFGYFPE